jgi:NAD(P)-dependent dehydrogenase (short-subunit alcohol dehydrogenase family)
VSAALALHGKRVLLTGASRGIGRAIAQTLLGAGARLAAVGRDRSTLEAVLAAAGDGHCVLTADLADAAQADRVVERATFALGGLDMFVSAAGIVEYTHLAALTPDAIERQHTVNFASPMRIALSAARVLPREGCMVFVASTLGLQPAPLTLAYGASKAALIAAVRSLALELAPRGIRVNAVAPGPVATDMLRVVRYAEGESPVAPEAVEGRIADQLAALRELHPLQRLGTPEDVAYSVGYLLTAPYVTGNILPVDGGLLLGSGAL